MTKIFPSQEGLEVKEDVTYECPSCHKTFPSEDVQTEKLPSNFIIVPLSSGSEIPKCPHCGKLAFFGLKEV